MRLALLGIDDEALRLVGEIARSDEHQLIYFVPATEQVEASLQNAEVQRQCPLAEILAGWEYLLTPGVCDAVIVAGPGGGADRLEPLRRFMQEQIPVFVTHPPPVSLLEAYELEVVRQEVKGLAWSLLLPWREAIWTDSGFPKVRDLEMAKAHCGPVEQLTCERLLGDRTRAAVLGWLARDIAFIRDLAGEVVQVATLAAMAPDQDEAQRDLSELTVQMTTDRRALVRWSVKPIDACPGLRLTLSGGGGRHRVDILQTADAAGDQITYAVLDSASASNASTSVENLPSRLDFVHETMRALQRESALPSNWPEAIRSLEIVEAVEKSLKKGRSIAVGVEGRTESDAFKGTMASVGCILLVVGLLVVIGAAVMLKIAEKLGNQTLVDVFRWWPVLLVGVFGAFLILQFLRFIIPEPGAKTGGRSASEDRFDA